MGMWNDNLTVTRYLASVTRAKKVLEGEKMFRGKDGRRGF